jgi:hypothetical protein
MSTMECIFIVIGPKAIIYQPEEDIITMSHPLLASNLWLFFRQARVAETKKSSFCCRRM